VKLFSDYLNLCDHNPPTLHTETGRRSDGLAIPRYTHVGASRDNNVRPVCIRARQWVEVDWSWVSGSNGSQFWMGHGHGSQYVDL